VQGVGCIDRHEMPDIAERFLQENAMLGDEGQGDWAPPWEPPSTALSVIDSRSIGGVQSEFSRVSPYGGVQGEWFGQTWSSNFSSVAEDPYIQVPVERHLTPFNTI